jgi:hypothetical protein
MYLIEHGDMTCLNKLFERIGINHVIARQMLYITFCTCNTAYQKDQLADSKK